MVDLRELSSSINSRVRSTTGAPHRSPVGRRDEQSRSGAERGEKVQGGAPPAMGQMGVGDSRAGVQGAPVAGFLLHPGGCRRRPRHRRVLPPRPRRFPRRLQLSRPHRHLRLGQLVAAVGTEGGVRVGHGR